MMKPYRYKALLSLILSLFPVSTYGAGLWLYEQASADMGLATAGRAALAQDASTAGANPAGMTRLERDQFEAGLLGIFVTAKFDADSVSKSGGNGGDAGDFVPAGNLAYVHGLSPDLKLGVYLGSNFGLGLNYDDDWAGRYYVQEGEIVVMGINPSLGYRVNNLLSIGAGLNVVYGQLTQDVAISNLLGNPDGKLSLDSDDVGIGYNLGALVELTPGTRLGLTYRSEIELQFDDAVDQVNLSPAMSTILDLVLGPDRRLDMELTVPQSVMFSAYHEVNERWAIMGNIGWQEQSAFGKTNISLSSDDSSGSLTADRNFHDTWHVAIGTQYRIAPQWLLALGIAYDESPVDNEDRTPDMPLDRQIRYGAGIQYV